MNKTAFRIIGLAVALLSPLMFGVQGAGSGLTASITLADGTSRLARLEGVGCSVSICSRTVVKSKAANDAPVTIRLDSIAAIRDTTASDALFVLKDGSARRLSLVSDFRVLYLASGLGSMEKLDLVKVKSVEFPGASK